MRKFSFALLAIFLAATTTVVAQDLSDMSSNSVSESVHSSLFVLDDGTILSVDHNVADLQLLGVSEPVFGSVEFNEMGELIYSRALGNEDLADQFYLLTDNPRSGMNMLVGEYNPTSNSLRFSPAVPDNEIILVINNGGPELRTFSLDGQNPSDVLEVIRQVLEGSYDPETDRWDRPEVLGGVVRLDGVTTFFGDPRVVFSIVTPEVAEELRERNAQGSNDLGFLFSGWSENLSQEERKLIFDLAIAAVDIGGILDPTPACDGVACAAELSQGNFIYAGINVVAMVPWLGDIAKTGKAGKFTRIVTEAIEYAAKNPKFAARIKPLLEVLSNALGRLPESVGKIFGGLKTKVDDFLDTIISEVIFGKNFGKKIRKHIDQVRKRGDVVDNIPSPGKGGIERVEQIIKERVANGGGRITTYAGERAIAFEDGGVTYILRKGGEFWTILSN